eukprot:g26915.t1
MPSLSAPRGMRKGQPPDPQVLDLLQTLVNDRGNTVVVLSGRTKEVMEDRGDRPFAPSPDSVPLASAFAASSPGVVQLRGWLGTLCRAWLSPMATALAPGRRLWCGMEASEGLSDDNQEWKNLAIELIQQYVRRIQGSILEAKACAISWNYREVGAAGVIDDVALELMRFLDPDSPSGLLHGYPVKVFMGKGYVEVKRADVDKGAACVKTLEDSLLAFSDAQRGRHMGSVDFVLCVGDDTSDEDMFQAVNRYFQAKGDVGGLSSALSQSSMGFKKSGCGSLASLDGLDVSPAESPRNSVSPKERAGGATRKLGFWVLDLQ